MSLSFSLCVRKHSCISSGIAWYLYSSAIWFRGKSNKSAIRKDSYLGRAHQLTGISSYFTYYTLIFCKKLWIAFPSCVSGRDTKLIAFEDFAKIISNDAYRNLKVMSKSITGSLLTEELSYPLMLCFTISWVSSITIKIMLIHAQVGKYINSLMFGVESKC